MKKHLLPLAALLASGLLAAAPARAQAPRTPAQVLNDRASRAFTRRHWLEAADLYAQAYALAPVCEFRFNRGLAFERAGRIADAAQAFRDYLQSDCTGRVQTVVPSVQARLDRLTALLPPPVPVVVPPVEPPVVAPPVEPPVVTPPVVVPPVIPPVVIRPPPPPPPVYRRQRRLTGLSYALWGAGAVGIGGGIYFLAAAANDRSLSLQGTEDPARHARAADLGTAIGWASVSVGAAAAATGVLWWLLGPTDRIAVNVDANPRHLVLGATVRLP